MSFDKSHSSHQEWAKNFTSTFYEGDHGKGKLEALKRKGRTDWDVLKENHRFLRPDAPDTEDGDANLSGYSYEDLLSLKYYNQLYKELAVIDLKHYKTGQLALRWRIEDELLEGIGQFTCANIRCEYHRVADQPLTTYQLDFAYQEAEDSEAGGAKSGPPNLVRKQALVKVVLCRRCGKKLNWKREQDKAALVESTKRESPRGQRSEEGKDRRRRYSRERSDSPRRDSASRTGDRVKRDYRNDR